MPNGYGNFRTPTKHELAHRASHRLFVGPLDGRDVMHTCDTPACVNPSHLRLGTRTENMCDAKSKGRMASGERHGQAKLSAEQVAQIRAQHGTQKQVAALFGISQSHVSGIKRGVKWAQPAEGNYHC